MDLDALTRRAALGLGAGALASGLTRPALALAAPPATDLFELALPVPGARAAADGWATTPVLRAPRRFDLLGLVWGRGAAPRAEVRARARSARWGPWLPVTAVGAHAPDGAPPVPGSDPVWTGRAELFQLRLRGDAGRLRARFVAVGRAPLRRARRAQALLPVGAPPIVTRPEWGAAAVPPRAAPSYGQVQMGFVHHTVSANAYGPQDSARMVLAICRYHRDSNRWNDIGYNFLVDRYGQIFEGRAGGIDRAVIGAQAQGWNSISTGVANLGTFGTQGQTEPALAAMAELLAWKLPLHGAPVEGPLDLISSGGGTNRWRPGAAVRFQRISGHRDGCSTSCPGDGLYAQLGDLRRRTGELAGPVSGLILVLRATQLRHPATARVTATLTRPDGSRAGGAAIDLQHRPRGGRWGTLASGLTGADGRWALSPPVPSSGALRAVFSGDLSAPGARSAAVDVTVRPLLSARLGTRRVAAGDSVRLAAAIQPARDQLTVTLERQTRSGWRRVWRRIEPAPAGRLGLSVRLVRPGLHRLRVTSGAGTAAGVGRELRVRAVRG